MERRHKRRISWRWFFITPNGSFWDPDYVYFNREGFEKNGGHYDNNGEFISGKGWDKENNCYESEKEDYDENEDENENEYNKNFNFGERDIDDLDEDIFDNDNLGKKDLFIKEIIEESKDGIKRNVKKDEKIENLNKEDKKEEEEEEDDKKEEEKSKKKTKFQKKK